MHLLALDIATITGWARWDSETGETSFGEQKFPNDIGEFADHFERWLLARLDGVDELAVEAPIPAQGHTQQQVLIRLYGANVIAQKAAFRNHLRFSEIPIATWRSHVIGTTRAPANVPASRRRAWLKQATINACRQLGYEVPDKMDNAGDALGILTYLRSVRDPLYGVSSTELFSVAA